MVPAKISFDDAGADLVLQAIRVQRDLGMLQHPEQVGFAPTEPREPTVQQSPDDEAIEVRPGADHWCSEGAPGWRVGAGSLPEARDQRCDVLYVALRFGGA